MERRIFEITIISAADVESPRRLGRTRAYARVSIAGKEKQTPVDRHGRTNPAWNFCMSFSVRESVVQSRTAMLVVKVFSRRLILPDRYIGQVHTSVKELFDRAISPGGCEIPFWPLMKGSAVARGGLKFSYRFTDKAVISTSPRPPSFVGWSHC